MHTRLLLINVQTAWVLRRNVDRLRGHVTPRRLGALCDNKAVELRSGRRKALQVLNNVRLSPALHAITSTETARTCRPEWIRQQKRYEHVAVRSECSAFVARSSAPI